MSKPSQNDIAVALQIDVKQVNQLQRRGMPVNKIRKSREWYDIHGFSSLGTRCSGGSKTVTKASNAVLEDIAKAGKYVESGN